MGNKLTKSSAILMTALTLGTSTISTAQAVFAETKIVKKSEANLSATAQHTATITGNGPGTHTMKIVTKPGKVAAGDFIEYTLRNMNPGMDLNGKDVVTADGTVIGKIEVTPFKTDPYTDQNNPKPNTDPTKLALDTANMKYDSKLKVVFNDKAATLDNISYTLNYDNQSFVYFASTKDYSYNSEIITDGKTIATLKNDVKAVSRLTLDDKNLSIGHATFTKTPDLNDMSGTLALTQNVNKQPLDNGEELEVDLTDPALKFDLSKLKVGHKGTIQTPRGYYGSNANPQGVVLNETSFAQYEVVSVTDKTIKIRVVGKVPAPNMAVFQLPITASPDVKRVDTNQSTFGNYSATARNLTRGTEQNLTANTVLAGANLSADGIKQLRSLTVKHVDTNGKEIYPGSSSNHNVGHNYATNSATVKGYKLKTTPGNAKGTLNDNTTVTYVYDQEVVTTAAPTTTTKATTVPTTVVTTKAPTTTVKPATPNNGGNTDPASGRNTTTTISTSTRISTVVQPTTTTAPTTVKPVTTTNPTTVSSSTRISTVIQPTTTTATPKKIITSFKDPNGKDLVPPTDGDKPKVDIPGYTYVKSTVDPDGNVIHHYEPVKTTTVTPKKVTTYFKDDKGNEVKPPVDGDQPKANIPGYEYVGTDIDPDGNIIHKYKKLEIKEAKPLPKTGDASSLIGLIGTGLASVIGLANFKRKK